MDVIPAFNRPGLLGLEEVVDERHIDRFVPTPITSPSSPPSVSQTCACWVGQVRLSLSHLRLCSLPLSSQMASTTREALPVSSQVHWFSPPSPGLLSTPHSGATLGPGLRMSPLERPQLTVLAYCWHRGEQEGNRRGEGSVCQEVTRPGPKSPQPNPPSALDVVSTTTWSSSPLRSTQWAARGCGRAVVAQ